MANNHSGEADDTIDRPFDEGTSTAIQTLIEDTVVSEYAAEQYSINTLFNLLSHPGRRYVLTYLLQSDGFVTISELVDYVTTKTKASMTDDAFRHKVTLELTHTHLPTLAEEGYIKYNMERQLIQSTEKTPAVEPFLRLALAQQRLVGLKLAQ